MKKQVLAPLAMALCCANSVLAADPVTVPAECKNLALMQGQLLLTRFHNNVMGDGEYNPAALTLKTNNGYKISKTEYLGGDSEDTTGPNAGKYPCDKDPDLCSNPADAGGSIDWARLTISTTDRFGGPFAEVVVSMGSRGGCTISSSKGLIK
jgi:hypothetical protein